MTPDVDAIRAALAAAKTGPLHQSRRLEVNAPVWLASLCDEIERLRFDLVTAMSKVEEYAVTIITVRTKLSAWRACADQLAEALSDPDTRLRAEALAVYERLKAGE